MSAQQSQGIQTLLEAEKEAAKIVAKARTYRTQKLKDARAEAAKEIEALKSSKESEFKKAQKEHEGDSGRSQANVDKTTDEQLKTLDTAFDKNRKAVVEKLLERLTEVEPQLHRNLKKVEA